MDSHGIVAVIITVCFFGSGQAYYYGRCRSCRQARSLDDCLEWTECDLNQVCYMEALDLPGGTGLVKQYNGGCRANDTCTKTSTSKKRDGALVSCSKCCNNDNYCNERLCGIKRANNLTMCNQCDGAFDQTGNHANPPLYPEDCRIRTVCKSDEVCFSSTITHGETSLTHFTSCKKKHDCLPLVKYILNIATDAAPAVGKRGMQICAMCCGDDMCNNMACEAIKGRLKNLYEDQWLDMNTLKEIL